MKKHNSLIADVTFESESYRIEQLYKGKRVISKEYGLGTIQHALFGGNHFPIIFEVLFDDGNYVKNLLYPEFTQIEQENE